MTVLGAVLAGGEARRFGADKALALLGERPLIEHALDSLRPHSATLVVCGRTDAPVPTLPDIPAPGLGPLGGIAAALAHARALGFERVLTTACDTPAIPRAILHALFAAGTGYAAETPVIGLWPACLAEALHMHLSARGARAVRRWAMQEAIAPVAPGIVVPNVNTPADLAALR